MIVLIDRSFDKDSNKIKDKSLLNISAESIGFSKEYRILKLINSFFQKTI